MKKILLVDDDVMMLQVLKKYLDSDYEVLLENSGARAIERLSNLKVDLIFLDVEMPIMNGLEVFKRIKLIEHCKNTPVLFFTGVSSIETVRNVMDNGAAGYFVKTGSKSELLAKVTSILGPVDRDTNVKDYVENNKKSITVLALETDSVLLREIKCACQGKYAFVFATNIFRAVSLLEKGVDVVLLGNITESTEGCALLDKIKKQQEKDGFKTISISEAGSTEELMARIGRSIGEKQ